MIQVGQINKKILLLKIGKNLNVTGLDIKEYDESRFYDSEYILTLASP